MTTSSNLTALTVLTAVCGFATTSLGITLPVPGAAPTIQAAIDLAQPGDFILVAPGVYPERIDLKGKSITLRSTDGPDVTTINASGTNGSTITCDSGEGPATRIEGFTVTGGAGTVVNGNIRGGGMYNVGSSPTVTDCVFKDNTLAAWAFDSKGAGAGMYNENANPIVRNCRFEGNDLLGCSGWLNGGGGMYNNASSPIISDCIFADSFANNGGGIMNVYGSHPYVVNSIIRDNEVSFSGGGVNCTEDANITLVNCVITGNMSYHGAGLYLTGSGMTVTNCTVTDNFATKTGAGAYFMYAVTAPTVRNSIFWDNTAVQEPANAEIARYAGANPDVQHSIVGGGYAGDGNLSADPKFMNASGRDFRLQDGSPARDSGHAAALPADQADIDYDGNTTEVVSLDFDRTPRQTGAGLDRGAFETAGAASLCPCDLTGDGFVGFEDLLIVMNFWGGLCNWCTDDLDGTGEFGLGDLVLVLAHWGACE